MAELVGSALLSAFFSVLFERLATQEVLNFLRPKKVINKLLEELKVLLWSADELLDDAEEKLIHNQRVENWHNELKDVVYKAGELVDKIETEAMRRKLERHQSASKITKMCTKLCSTPLSSFDSDVKDEVEEILSSPKLLLAQKEALGLEPAGKCSSSGIKTRLSERVRPAPIADESHFYGREEIKALIIDSLLRSADVSGEKIAVIPIIGAGGLGKTTLAQIIYDHPNVKHHFGELRVWVTVSTEFDLQTVAKKIIGKVSGSSQIDVNVDEQDLLFKLKDALKEKKFLLVLDDVWNENSQEWNILKSCFQSGEYGSKVIVTTRNRKVASIMAPNQTHHFLPELPEEDCWLLFAKTVFTSDQDREAHPDLQEIGEQIVKKCSGLPLSVVSVGGILCCDRDPEKWKSILRSSVWELLQQNSKNIIPSLWLSYRYLPSHLKRCFAYFAILPKGFQIQKTEVVQWWMAEGFFKNVPGCTMEKVGGQYFDDQISRSLLQRSSEDRELFIMHDLVQDLAVHESGQFCFWLDGDKILPDFVCKTRHLSYTSRIEDVKKFDGLSKAKRLHAFIGFGQPTKIPRIQGLNFLKLLEELLMEGGCLRVLSVYPTYTLQSLPDSIGNLKHLRFLNLAWSDITELPDSIGTLYNLQTLILSWSGKLTRLPRNMGSLINLHHLYITSVPLEQMPPDMCKLKNLQTLTDFVLGKHSGSSIRDLGVLHNLDGRLCVSGLQNVNKVEDVLKANLKDKNLSELALEWEGDTDDSRHVRKVLEALQPHAGLKELAISKYGGTSFPDWVGNSLVSKIEKMYLNNCKDCLYLPPLGSLVSLKELKIKGFNGVETIGDEFYGNDSPFRSLEVLHFEDMPEWRTWSIIGDDKHGVFPRLLKLELNDCPKLVTGIPGCENLSFPGIHRYPSLQSLNIKNSCGSMKSLPLDHFPMLDELKLKGLSSLFQLTGHSADELKTLVIRDCPTFESLGCFRYLTLQLLVIERCDVMKSIPLDYFPELQRLFLRSCHNFKSLMFSEEPPLELESLNFLQLWDMPKFVSFPDGGLPAPDLKDLRICECENLRSLPRQMHKLNPSLEILVLVQCPEIELFPEGGLPSSLETLRISECRKLTAQRMHWDLQTLARMRTSNISGCEDLLDSFPPKGLLPNSLTTLEIINFPRLKTLNIHAFQRLTRLTVIACYELQCLPEESLPDCLSFLYIEDCPLLERRYQKETGEGWHKISYIPNVKIKSKR